jgi:hypothetical protein
LDSLGQGVLAVKTAPPENKVEAYNQFISDMTARGFGPYMKDWPAQYAPAVDAKIDYHVNRLRHAQDYFKQQEGGIQPPGGFAGAAAGPAVGFDVGRASNAIAGLESGGNYGAVGPDTGNGNKALGKYQVLASNVPGWTAEILGKPMSPQEFLASPEAQDAVFKGKFGQYVAKYGHEGAARAWFAGEGGMNNAGAKDALGTTVGGYGAKFAQAYGAPPAGGPPVQLAGGPPAGAPMPQGGDQPTGNQPGVMPGPPAPDIKALHQYVPPGMVMGVKDGLPAYDHQGRLVVFPQGATRRDQAQFIEVPKPGEDKKGPPGPLGGTGIENQMMNILLKGDPATQEYAAAYAYVSRPRTAVDPATNQITIVPPMDTSMFAPPAFGRGGQPTGPLPPPANSTETQLPNGSTITQIQGHGRPIPGTENETISKNVQAINTIDKALDVMKNPREDAQPSGRTAGFLSRNLGQTGDLIAQTIDPAGVPARALLADINSQLLLARSGAAVTEGEFKRLVSLLPAASDKPEVIQQKLQQVRDTYAGILKGQAGQYTQKNGFIPHEGAQAIISGQAQAPAGGAPKPGTVQDGYLFNGGDPSKSENWRKVQ